MADTSKNGRRTMASLGYTEQFTWGSSEQDPEPPVAKRHWGKYRGTVVDNQDITSRGRLLVSVPGIVITNWAMPCVPVTDILTGTFMRPGIDANVWVEFERGDPDKPIWVGCWWGEGEIPAMAKQYSAVPAAPAMAIESTTAGISVCDVPILAGGDTPGNVNIKAGGGAVTIALTEGSVNVTAPDVTTIAAATVNVSAPDVTTTADATVNVSAPDVTTTASAVTTTADATVNVSAPTVTITGTEALSISAPAGALNINAAAALGINAEGALDISASGVTISAPAVAIVSPAVTIAGATVSVIAEAAVDITAPAVAIEAAVAITGALIVNEVPVV